MDNVLMTKETIDAVLMSEDSVSGSLDSSDSINGRVSTSGNITASMIQTSQVDGNISNAPDLELKLVPKSTISAKLTLPESRSGGTNDYEELINKPKINDVTLIKNKSFEDLGLSSLSNLELETLLR